MGKITRRDFINGTLVAAGSSLLPFQANSGTELAALDSSYYPPARTGLRGSHPGSKEHAHSRAWAQRSDWGPTARLPETYDLIIVGGGLSGLSAAYFYQQKHGRDKKVLIVDNHDDFGGHAKRNEHTINGNTRISYGGSQALVDPHQASKVVRSLFNDIGIDLKRFKTAYDHDFFKRHDLGAVTYFNKQT
ncbi:MAG: FAD/NAD(P)-binding protein, partial [Roseibacillus sp.]